MVKHLTLAASALLALATLATANAAPLTDAARGHGAPHARTLRPRAPTKPIAYGYVSSDGTLTSGTSNVSVTYNAAAGWYEITITGVDYYYSHFSTNMTTSIPVGNAVCQTDSVNGLLLARCYDSTGAATQADFSFTTF